MNTYVTLGYEYFCYGVYAGVRDVLAGAKKKCTKCGKCTVFQNQKLRKQCSNWAINQSGFKMWSR